MTTRATSNVTANAGSGVEPSESTLTHSTAARPPVGVLFVNLGTPDSPAVADVRRYLRQFLSDERVVDLPRILWLPLLHGIILPIRAKKSAHAYAQVWTSEGSPLLAISRKQAASLARELGPDFRVALAMRYGSPSIEAGLRELVDAGCEVIRVLTAFPQYSESTVGSVVAEVARVAKERGWPAPIESSKRERDVNAPANVRANAAPAVRTPTPIARTSTSSPRIEIVPPWFDDIGYIRAVAETCRAHEHERTRTNPNAAPIRHWVFSFHGLPQRYVDRGDPYRDHCDATARALATEMRLREDEWTMTFQSRFGPETWLQPYTDVRVPELVAQHGCVAIAMPGFLADCLETIEEIGIRLVEDCARRGEPVVVPCVNDSRSMIVTLQALSTIPD